jgi:hypothetical protein
VELFPTVEIPLRGSEPPTPLSARVSSQGTARSPGGRDELPLGGELSSSLPATRPPPVEVPCGCDCLGWGPRRPRWWTPRRAPGGSDSAHGSHIGVCRRRSVVSSFSFFYKIYKLFFWV